MPTGYTSVLKLALPVTGELSGSWGNVVNDNITAMVEQAVTGVATVNTWTSASHTLTTANGTTSESRCAVLQCSGSPGAAATVVCPTATKIYVVKNEVAGGYSVTIKTSAGTGILVPNGKTVWVYCDGTNVVQIGDYLPSLSLGTPLIVSAGGTGLSLLTANYIPYGNGTSAFQASANLQFDGTVMRVGSNAPLGLLTNPVIAQTGAANDYIQGYIYNATNGAKSSSDFVAYANNSSDTKGWADLGYTSASYADTVYTVTGPNEAYLFGSSGNAAYTGNLVYATDNTGTTNAHQWYVGGFTQAKGAWKMQLTSAGLQLSDALPVASGGTGVTTSTGTGSVVRNTSPTLVTPLLGTPTSGVMTNVTGLPLTTGVTGTLLVANGGTGTTTPTLIGGTNITVTGTWPNQTVNATGGTIVQSITTNTTITPTPATCTQYDVTALASNAVIATPTGSPVDGQKLIVRIKDDGTARILTWTLTSGAYRAVGCTLPTTTVVSKVVYIGIIYNSQDSFWDAVSVAQL